jgi:NADH-quinone oxidoreductase subunit K
MIGIEHYVIVSSILFVLGVLGIFLNRKNVIIILMAIELILLAVNINFVAFSAFLQDLTGQIFAIFVLTVAAGEAAIGLAILVIYFRGRGSIAVDDVNRMKGLTCRPSIRLSLRSSLRAKRRNPRSSALPLWIAAGLRPSQ